MPPRPPFDDADADLIFRSSDNVDFHLYKNALVKASPIIREMVPISDTTDGSSLQTVSLSEDADTLEHLFRCCYPFEHKIATIEDVRKTLEAARKYELAGVVANLRWIMKQLLDAEPLRVYALAYQYQIEDLTREAANLLLDDPQSCTPTDFAFPELNSLPAVAIFAMFGYRKRCAEAIRSILDDRGMWMLSGDHERKLEVDKDGDLKYSTTWAWFYCSTNKDRSQSFRCAQGKGPQYACCWWTGYLKQLRGALAERPTGRTLRSLLFSNVEVYESVLAKIRNCGACRERAFGDLRLFNELLVQKIDNAVSEVKLELDFWG